jgi:hypothetical protein
MATTTHDVQWDDLTCPTCAEDVICTHNLPPDPTDAALEILADARRLVREGLFHPAMVFGGVFYVCGILDGAMAHLDAHR